MIIKTSKVWRVEFEINPTATEAADWASIIRLTIGGNEEAYGDRTPVVFFHPGTTKLWFGSAIDGQASFEITTDNVAPLNQWTRISISQSKIASVYVVTIEIDGQQITAITNNQPEEFETVKVWMAFYPVLRVLLL